MLLFPQPFRVKVRRRFIHLYSSETAIGSKDIQASWAHGSYHRPQSIIVFTFLILFLENKLFCENSFLVDILEENIKIKLSPVMTSLENSMTLKMKEFDISTPSGSIKGLA